MAIGARLRGLKMVQAYAHARSVGLTLLAAIRESVGSLDRTVEIEAILEVE